MRLLLPPLQEVASCGFASIAGSTFNANAAGGAGGALSSDGATLPVALSCDAATAANALSYATAAEQQRNFTVPSFPSGGHHVTVPMFITSVIAVGMLETEYQVFMVTVMLASSSAAGVTCSRRQQTQA